MPTRLPRQPRRARLAAATVPGATTESRLGVAWVAAENNQGGIAFAAGAFVAVLVAYRLLSWVWQKLRSLFQMPVKEPLEKAFELRGKMVLAYDELKGSTSSSLQRVREVLAKIADEGAAWDPGVFSVLDAAIARWIDHNRRAHP